MKYRVTFSCNHTDLIDINGTANQIRQRIEYLTTEGLCPVCYGHKMNAVMAVGCHEEEMFYGRYKNEYSDCKYKKGSYDPATKMITVYVPDDRYVDVE